MWIKFNTLLLEYYKYNIINFKFWFTFFKDPSDEPTLNLSMDSKPLPVTKSIVNIKSGHKIELNCNVQGGNPKPVEIIYTKNGQNIGTGSQAFIFVTHEDQNAILGCSAQNQYWTTDSSELRLNILCE